MFDPRKIIFLLSTIGLFRKLSCSLVIVIFIVIYTPTCTGKYIGGGISKDARLAVARMYMDLVIRKYLFYVKNINVYFCKLPVAS